MEFGWRRQEQQFREALRAFIRDQVSEKSRLLVPGEDPYSQDSVAFCKRLAERGWLVPHWPAEYGGGNASPWMFVILSEELWAAGEEARQHGISPTA